MIIDKGLKNKNTVTESVQKYEMKRVIVSAYDPKANRMIKRRHKLIVDAFSKMSDRGSINWVQNLPAILWKDQFTVCTSTGLIISITKANLFSLLS